MADTIFSRFVNARAAVKNPPLDSTNPHFRNRYASLSATLSEVNAACVRNGIAYVQTLREAGEGYNLTSFIIDGEGNRLELSQFPVSHVPNPQNFGSEMTYKKRQQAQADWGIVGDEDDDGEAAATPHRPKPKAQPKPVKADPPTPKQRMWAAITAYCKATGTDREAELELLGGADFIARQTPDWFDAKAEYYEAQVA